MSTQIINQANMYYNYNSASTTYSGMTASNPLSMYLVDGGVTLDKSVYPTFANVSSNVVYTLVVSNLGTETLSNVILTDTLPFNITYIQNSLSYGGTSIPNADIRYGVTLPNMAPNTVITVTFSGAILNSIGSTATNISNLAYTVTTPTTTIPIQIKSNPATLNIFNNNLVFTKYQIPTQMNIGDTGTYFIMISNLGTVSANNITVIDTIPQGLSYIPNTFFVNGVPTQASNPLNAFIPKINPNEGILISYGFTAVSTPNGGVITNVAELAYSYTLPTGSIVNSTLTSNPTTMNVTSLSIVATQVAGLASPFSLSSQSLQVGGGSNQTDVKVGDIVSYTLLIQNPGTLNVTNMYATGEFPIFSLGYVPNSLSINNVSVPDQNLILGLSLPDLSSAGIVTVNFLATVLNDSIKTLTTTFQIYFDAGTIVSTQSISSYATAQNQTNSNPWSLYVLNPSITASKTSNLMNATKGTTINYSIVLKNSGSDVLNNITFYDTLPTGLTFLSGSIVNPLGGISNIGNPSFGVSISQMGINSVYTVNINAIGY